jgi:hypothetical protein
VRFAESFCAEIPGHGRLLLQRSDGANSVVDLGFPQLIGGESSQVPTADVVPHTLGPSGERLDPALNEGADQLEARHLFLGCGSELSNLLHQGLHDRHLFFGQLVRPRRSGPKDVGRTKLIKPEFLTDGGLVLGVKPFYPPIKIVLRRPKIEVLDIRAHLTAKTAGLIMERAPDDENLPPERPVGFDPQEAFAQCDKTRYVQDSVGIQIVKLNPVSKKESVEEGMRRKRESTEKEGEEKYPEAHGWLGNDFGPGDENFRRVILQDANLLGAL